jgi:RNA polymerase sigma-70 factor (ECF subfamily)
MTDAGPAAGTDPADWIEHYRQLEKPLYNVVYRWLWDAEESHDVVQEAFLRCWHRRARIRPEGFRAFVYKTALNLAANRRRRKKLWQLVSFDAEGHAAVDGDAASCLMAGQIRAAIDDLPASMKNVLLLKEFAGMSYQEIAAATGIKTGTVGSRHNRALTQLRRRLGGSEDRNE